MTAVDNVGFAVGDILAGTLRLAGIERKFIFTPDHQQARLLLAHPCLPFRIGVHIGAIVVEEVALNLSLPGLIEKIEFIGPKVRVVAIHVWIISDMARTRSRQREKICAQRGFVWSAIGPKGPSRLPILSQAVIVRDRILNDES